MHTTKTTLGRGSRGTLSRLPVLDLQIRDTESIAGHNTVRGGLRNYGKPRGNRRWGSARWRKQEEEGRGGKGWGGGQMRGSGKNGKQASFVATATWIYGSLRCPVYGHGFVRRRGSLPTTPAYPFFVAFSPPPLALFRAEPSFVNRRARVFFNFSRSVVAESSARISLDEETRTSLATSAKDLHFSPLKSCPLRFLPLFRQEIFAPPSTQTFEHPVYPAGISVYFMRT